MASMQRFQQTSRCREGATLMRVASVSILRWSEASVRFVKFQARKALRQRFETSTAASDDNGPYLYWKVQ